LRSFYRGVANGHRFGIVVRNFGGAAFCDNAHNCVNDGGEFKLANGQFVNAKRTETDEDISFVPANYTTIATPFRKFMGSDGLERLWLTKSTTGTLVGEYVWDGEGEKVQITSEIPS